ncbi:MAG: hypothetical protein HY259_11930 [Chloroflexi bacterium]|nr:hypothetical protein [Chloroflexota bacterium]
MLSVTGSAFTRQRDNAQRIACRLALMGIAALAISGCDITGPTLPLEAQQKIISQYEMRGSTAVRRAVRLEIVGAGKPTALPKDNEVDQVVCVKVRFEDDVNQTGNYTPRVRSVVAKRNAGEWVAPTESEADWREYGCPPDKFERQ